MQKSRSKRHAVADVRDTDVVSPPLPLALPVRPSSALSRGSRVLAKGSNPSFQTPPDVSEASKRQRTLLLRLFRSWSSGKGAAEIELAGTVGRIREGHVQRTSRVVWHAMG